MGTNDFMSNNNGAVADNKWGMADKGAESQQRWGLECDVVNGSDTGYDQDGYPSVNSHSY